MEWITDEYGTIKITIDGWDIEVRPSAEIYVYEPDRDADVELDVENGIFVRGESDSGWHPSATTVNIPWAVLEAFIEARHIANRIKVGS